ncbi:MAG: hypothetical protein HDQ44_02070, partial [Desulfovibrio sp.]|nr:hypothetical protein [Desulfovibrio sp.]
ASCIGGTATIGMIGLAFRCGWPAFWWLGSGAIGLLLLGLFLAKKVRATRAATLPEIIQMRLGSKCRVFASVMILLSSIAVVGAQFNALGLILASLLPIKFGVATLLGALSVFVYTFIGGQRAVIHSDRWQFLVFLSSLALVLLFLLSRPECLAALRHTPAELYNDRLPLQRIIYFLLVFGSSFVIGPMIFGRLLSAKSPMLARKGTLRAALGLALMALLIVAIGIAMTGLDLAVAEQDNALFDSLKGGLPPWLGLYISIGLLCAIISSADSCLLTASFVWASGLRRKGDIPTARKAMLVLTLMACAIVFTDKGILGLLLAASDIYVGGIICPVLLALLSARQHDNNLMLCAMLAGGVCGVGAALTANANWSFTGMALSLLIAGLAFAVKCGKNQG